MHASPVPSKYCNSHELDFQQHSTKSAKEDITRQRYGDGSLGRREQNCNSPSKYSAANAISGRVHLLPRLNLSSPGDL
ncbi:unnamed protein product [Calypogeia fissa]